MIKDGETAQSDQSKNGYDRSLSRELRELPGIYEQDYAWIGRSFVLLGTNGRRLGPQQSHLARIFDVAYRNRAKAQHTN
jgi:hypothetical protein